MIGKSIAHYSITAKIGAGGMGEVYRATDTKLGRDVALKILPAVFSTDAQRMARFQREAQFLASLNHANIASIYGVEESEGRRALVLELVEGEDLSQRLAAGPVPMEETFQIARQIAEALEAAHDKGVVHRDLKPANVKLTQDGSVKVLDFGLAKALEGDPGASGTDIGQSLSPTLTQAATQAGVILGTAAYMSPEQAKGKVVDRRSDIFSFGLVLFEMLSNEQCFTGETVSDTLAAVLKSEPAWDLLPAETPAALIDLLRRCLEKDPRQRLQSIGEARIVLDRIIRGESPITHTEASTAPLPATGLGAGAALRLGLIVLGLAAAATAGWWAGSSSRSEPPTRRFTIEAEDLFTAFGRTPIISPDGKRIAYIAEDHLWIRDLDSLTPRRVPESEGARSPFWSPDGASLAWGTGTRLYRMDASGGEPVVLTELDDERSYYGAWGADGTIYFTSGSRGIRTISSLGGEPRVLLDTVKEEVEDYHSISLLPDGRGIIYTVHTSDGPGVVEVMSGADGSERVRVLDLAGQRIEGTMYAPGGYLVFARQRGGKGVWAVPFSLGTLSTTGEPFLLDPEGNWPSVSRDGTLLYVRGAGGEERQLAIVDREGNLIEFVGPPQTSMGFPELSWDATSALVSAREGDNRDIWKYDLDRGVPTRLTFDEAPEFSAVWLPGDEKVVFSRGGGRSSIWAVAADGTGGEAKIIEKGQNPSFRPGAPFAAFSIRQEDTAWDIHQVPLDSDGIPRGEPEPVVDGPTNDYDVQVSPDGSLIAYASRESGTETIYIKEFPGGGGKWQVSSGESYWPRWSREGDTLYFLDPAGGVTSLMRVKVERVPALRLSTPEKLFDESAGPGLLLSTGPRSYDVFPGGERFLVLATPGDGPGEQPSLVINQNWLGAFGEKKN